MLEITRDDFISCHETLNLPIPTSLELLKKNYQGLIKKYHPDVCKDKSAVEMSAKINHAYGVLKECHDNNIYYRLIEVNNITNSDLHINYSQQSKKETINNQSTNSSSPQEPTPNESSMNEAEYEKKIFDAIINNIPKTKPAKKNSASVKRTVNKKPNVESTNSSTSPSSTSVTNDQVIKRKRNPINEEKKKNLLLKKKKNYFWMVTCKIVTIFIIACFLWIILGTIFYVNNNNAILLYTIMIALIPYALIVVSLVIDFIIHLNNKKKVFVLTNWLMWNVYFSKKYLLPKRRRIKKN